MQSSTHPIFPDSPVPLYSQLADTDKDVAKAYGVVGLLGMVRRSIFVLDAQGMIRYVHRSAVGLTFRPVDELVAALRSAV